MYFTQNVCFATKRISGTTDRRRIGKIARDDSIASELSYANCRNKHLKAKPYESNDERSSHLSGHKLKTVKIRIREVTSEIPQVREGVIYLEVLEKGLCSEAHCK